MDVRDEATAVFAADATARLSGIPGVAAVTAGPGIANTITALKNTQLAQSPLVLFGGAAPTALQGRGALQDIDQRPLVQPHVERFIKIRRVRDLGPAVDTAFALARNGVPAPVFMECPVDVLYDEISIRQWYADAAATGTSLRDRILRSYPEPPRGRHVRPPPSARRHACAGRGYSQRLESEPACRVGRSAQGAGDCAGGQRCRLEQVKLLHDDVAIVLARTAYRAVAAGFGAEGILVRQMDEVPGALARARARALAASGQVVLVNVWLDKTAFREGSIPM